MQIVEFTSNRTPGYLASHGLREVYVVRQNKYSTRYAIRVPKERRWHYMRLARRRGRNVISYPAEYERKYIDRFRIAKDNAMRCRYCGKRLGLNTMEADHVIPVSKAKTSRFYRWLLKIRGINNVNDPRNVVPACTRCNRKKADHTGIWLYRAWRGKYRWLIMIEKIIYAVLGIILITVVVMAVTGVIDMSGLIAWVKDAAVTVYEFFKGLILGASA